ncbi:hypothetical protein [Fibrella aquatica]|jgi:hypothetical protein|uniref:hypothetical protein n=1 Tax=Fibrella aquatica TaxID=3242487 RepID=UPI003522508A
MTSKFTQPGQLAAVDQAIERGIGYLHQHQYPNGEFCCYMAPDRHMQEWCVPDSTVFPTAVIVNSLLTLADHPAVEKMLNRAVPFFQYQMMHGGVWNYYTRWHPLFKLNPADVDDTSYVATFLKAQQVGYPSDSTRALMLANRNRQGVVYTWFVLRPRLTMNRTYWRVGLREMKRPIRNFLFWQQHECTRADIDGVVNANVLYYLGENEATQGIIRYLLDVVTKQQENRCDNWYHSPINFYYALGRTYQLGIIQFEAARSPVLTRLMMLEAPHAQGQFGQSVMETALALSALIFWQGDRTAIDRAVLFLLQKQDEYGEWPRAIFFYSGRSETVGWGSEELTTAFCLEALALYRKYINDH